MKFAKLNYVELETKKQSDFESSFVLQPLERGFGNTIGNTIRRVLISSIKGVSSFAIKIANVDHEFQTITGVTEDIVQIILNIKNVNFVFNPEAFENDEVVRIYLKAKKGDVTAMDFELPMGIQVVNKDEHIATVAKDDVLELEVFLMVGRGFVSFEENKIIAKNLSSKINSKIKSGSLIAIDSDFSPINKVSYESIELNSSSNVIEERLTINIKTNGSVEAKDAISQAAHVLISHLEILRDVSNLEKEQIFETVVLEEKEVSNKSISLSMLDLSVRSYNCLKRASIESLEDLSKLTMNTLSNINNLGKKSLDEIIAKLSEYNIVLKDDGE